MNTESIIRPATQAYRFYEGDPQRLREEVNSFLARHKAGDSDQDVAALIVPHAGYYYSGNVAAKAFKQLNPERKYSASSCWAPVIMPGSTVPQWMARQTSMPHRWVTCQ